MPWHREPNELTSARRAKWDAFWLQTQVAAEATHRLSAELVAQRLRAGPDTVPRVLDLGCGSGRVLQLLEQAGCWVVGTDLAEGALAAAAKRLGRTAPLVRADAFELAVADASFDAVVSLGYASVGSYPGVQSEVARVLRPGGQALIDFRHVGLYHFPLLPLQGRRLLAAWRRGEVACPILGLRPAPRWAADGLVLEAVVPFNTFPPLGRFLPADIAVAFEQRFGIHVRSLLARTVLACFRRGVDSSARPLPE